MTIEQKAKAFDDLVWRINISAWWSNNPEEAKSALESILHYTLWIYAWCTMTDQAIIGDRDTEYDDNWDTYDNLTRWLLCPIQEEVWNYWYKTGKKILQPKTK